MVEKDRIESVIKKAQVENVRSLVDIMELKLFNCALSSPKHVLY